MKPAYFLLYCEEDSSHAVVPAEDVFKLVPKRGQKVKFFYDSSERSYEGEVIEIGGMSGLFLYFLFIYFEKYCQ